jgi:hypothetical protein
MKKDSEALLTVTRFLDPVELMDPLNEETTREVGDFLKIRTPGKLFIDKSIFIYKFLQDSSECNVILRPRKFGKSLNLSMLKYFLSDQMEPVQQSRLFDGLQISQIPKFCESQMGKYAIVHLGFKQCNEPTWDRLKSRIASKMKDMLMVHVEFLDALLPPADSDVLLKDRISRLRDDDMAELPKNLIRCLDDQNRSVIFLVDEYDAPLNSKMHSQEDEELRDTFFENLYSDALKSNTSLYKACLVGVAEIRAKGILSGVNNLGIACLQDTVFDDCFGFVAKEVKLALQMMFSMGADEAEREWSKPAGIKEWYNGYCFGSQQIVNPLSFSRYLYEDRTFRGYWGTNRGCDTIINLIREDTYFATKLVPSLQYLLRMETISGVETYKKLDISQFDPGIRRDPTWSNDKVFHFLCMTGYLTYQNTVQQRGQVWIPNRELFDEWGRIVSRLAGFETVESMNCFFADLIDASITFDVHSIERAISMKINTIPSRSEYTYECFVCGLLTVFNSAFGRTVMDKRRRSIVIEFKKAHDFSKLKDKAKEALKRMFSRRYFDSSPTDHDILLIGCAISDDKQVEIASAVLGTGPQRSIDIETVSATLV